MSVDKSGGDALNMAAQGAVSGAAAIGAAAGGPGFLDGVGGNADSKTEAESKVDQMLDQHATAGDGGSDQTHANTNIDV